ncbi:terpenoid synthase [Aspergillus homomorphus CBS 101889]|uniref:Terpenoid synthase n=1 Tax=Aspergillus homomorphus (strain CBS 101889) TaxID=1450537 RepID=A0A395HJW6_ASPHC|nr:terpenoid synthase [Aspergillus homomorphus CBS 101889]RAL07906.1 terpenoid synthase [Aspergillus homomorphus CBS 101889]
MEPSNNPPNDNQTNPREEEKPTLPKTTLLAPFQPVNAEDICRAPIEYTQALPGKATLTKFITALESWFQTPEEYLTPMREITATLFTTILVLDDIEDSTPLRRGHPAAHIKYGLGQTVNSATYTLMTLTASIAQRLGETALQIFFQELKNLGAGQALDLHWTFEQKCPSLAEYLGMVDNKTGSLFRLVVRWMRIGTGGTGADTGDEGNEEVLRLVALLGRYYQIRDDYLNLVDLEYTAKKGRCEDLDEGKFSFPLVCTLSRSARATEVHRLVFPGPVGEVRRGLADEEKEAVVEAMRECGAFEYTLTTLEELWEGVWGVLDEVEARRGANAPLRRLILSMKV